MDLKQRQSFPIPVGYFSIILGLSALGLAWRVGNELFPALPVWVAEGLLLTASAVWFCFIFAYVHRWIYCRQQALDEIEHVITGGAVALVPISTMFVGMALVPYFNSFGKVILAFGIIAQLGFASYYVAGRWRGTHSKIAATPVMYLPIIPANFVSATALASLGYMDIASLFLGAGFIGWLMFEPIVLHRLRTETPLVEQLRPVLGIQLAPAFVGCSAYLTLNGGQVDLLVKFLIGYGLLQTLLLARLLPWIFACGFTPSAWAFSFGLGSMAKVGIILASHFPDTSLGWLGGGMFGFGSIGVSILVVGTLYLLLTGRFFSK